MPTESREGGGLYSQQSDERTPFLKGQRTSSDSTAEIIKKTRSQKALLRMLIIKTISTRIIVGKELKTLSIAQSITTTV